jgi:Flp pilus assembly protein TadD
VAYLGDLLAPRALSPFYRYPASLPVVRWAAAALFLAVLTGLAVSLRRRCPWLLAGWCWYLIALVPVVGLVQVGFQSRADRYTYLPLIGIYLALAASAVRFATGSPRRRAAVAAAALLALTLLAGLAHRQAGWWRDNETLFGRALALDPDNWMAHFGLGNALLRKGDVAGSILHYEAVRRGRPQHEGLALRLGTQYAASGRYEEAASVLAEAVRQEPRSPEAAFQYATALANLGRDAEAIHGYTTLLGLAPGHHDAHLYLAGLLARNGRPERAEREFRQALALQPDNADSWNGLGALLAGRKAWDEAAEAFTRAVRLRPGDARFRENLRLLEALRAGESGGGPPRPKN